MTELLPCPFCNGPAQIMSGAAGCHSVRCEGCSATSDDRSNREHAIAAWNRRAAPVQAPVAPVAVKPLEWRQCATRKIQDLHLSEWHQIAVLFSESILGTYGVVKEDNRDHFDVWLASSRVSGPHKSKEAAKAAAQADYETRIRSALASLPKQGER